MQQIYFCDEKVVLHNDKMFQEAIKRHCMTIFQSTITYQFYEFSNEFATRAMHRIPHLLSLRTSGTKYFLLLTRINGANETFFVRRNIFSKASSPSSDVIVSVRSLKFHDDLYSNGGTLFEGEMVRCNKSDADNTMKPWRFIINDVVGRNGVHLRNVNICKRLWMINDIFRRFYEHTVEALCDFETCHYYHYNEFNAMMHEASRKDNAYTYTSIIFKPMHLKFSEVVLDIANGNMKMWTEQRPIGPEQQQQQQGDDNTALFYAMRTPRPDTYLLYDDMTSDMGRDRIAAVNSLDLSKQMARLFGDALMNERRPVHCTFSHKFGRWVPCASF